MIARRKKPRHNLIVVLHLKSSGAAEKSLRGCLRRAIIEVATPQLHLFHLAVLYRYLVRKHGFSIHLYADDTQLYVEFNPLYHNMANIEESLIKCLEEVKAWMSNNKLKLNPDKTEVLTVQKRNNFNPTTVKAIQLETGKEPTETSRVVKSLGVLFDEHLTFEDHVNSVIKSANVHLRNLRVIASKLDYELKRQLIH